MVAIPYTLNFGEQEFKAATSIEWTLQAALNAERFSTALLQPLRRAMSFPIVITEYGAMRARGGRGHPTFEAVDIVPADRDPAKIERMFQWLATYKSGEFGELIQERTHVHVTLPGVGGNGQILREPVEGQYVLGGIAQALFPAGVATVVGYLLGIFGRA